MNRADHRGRVRSDRRPGIPKAGLPALLAVGSGLAVGPAAALELGDLTVESRLGQPLRASIAYVLAPNEQIGGYCVSLTSGFGGGDLPAVSGASISAANGVISLTGTSAIREPLMSARVVVDCPYTPHLSREYMLFIDPAEDPAPVVNAVVTTAEIPTATAAPAATARTVQRPKSGTGPVIQGTRYRVQPGQTLSEIAQGVEGRRIALWPAVNAIFEANPDAFIDNDPNKLKAGSWLEIPAMTGTATTARFADDATRTAPAAQASTASAAVYEGAEALQPSAAPASSADTAEETAIAAAIAAAANEPEQVPVRDESRPQYSELEPGDVIVNAAGERSRESVVIPDTALDAPDLSAAGPNARTASIATARADDAASRGWLYWLVGSGVALFAFLLLFGKRIRERFGSTPIGVVQPHPMRRQADRGDAATVETLAIPDPGMEIEAELPYADIDFDLSDDSPTEENLALDADLVMGTGLEQGTDMDVNQDFGFAMTTKLDMELPEFAGRVQEEHETDIIPPPERTSTSAILESEVLPEDDDYDMSVIVDATKMPLPEDVTERDLMAVAVTDDEHTLIEDDYTISKEVDYEILEQDYEDELTATQALNKEIEKAAAELAERMDDDDVSSTKIKLATVTELDVGADERAQNDDDGSDDAAITANIRAEDKTINLQVEDDDDTREMASDSDRTAEMEIESGKVDTRTG